MAIATSPAAPPLSQTSYRSAREKDLDTVRAIIFNRATEKTTAEHEAAEVALAETVARKAELGSNPNLITKDGLTLTRLDTLLIELQKRKQTIQCKEREIVEFHKRYISQYGESVAMTRKALSSRDDEILRQYDVETARASVDSVEDGSICESTNKILDAVHTLKAEHELLAKLAKEEFTKQEATMARMEEADRILVTTKKSLSTISKRQMMELAHYNKPPKLVLLCLSAIFDLLGLEKNLGYKKMKVQLLKPSFRTSMETFGTSTVTKKKLDRLDATYLTLPEFTVEKMKRASVVCGILTEWLLSLRNVCKNSQDTAVQELRKELSARQTLNLVGNDVAGVRGAGTGNMNNGIDDQDFTMSSLSFIDSTTFAHVEDELTEFKQFKAEEEARLKAEEEQEALRIQAANKAKTAAEAEAKAKTISAAVEEAERLRVVEEAKIKAKEEEDARLQAEDEAKAVAEEAKRLKLVEEAKIAAEEAAKVKAHAKRVVEEEAKIKAEEDARLQAEEAARIAAAKEDKRSAEEAAKVNAAVIEEAKRLKDEEEVRVNKIAAEAEAKAKAATEEANQLKVEEARIKAEEEQEAMHIRAVNKTKKSAEAKAKAILISAASTLLLLLLLLQRRRS